MKTNDKISKELRKQAEKLNPADIPFDYELYQGFKAVRSKYLECEKAQHKQIVSVSTYMDDVTQVCFSEQIVRTTNDVRPIVIQNLGDVPKELFRESDDDPEDEKSVETSAEEDMQLIRQENVI